MQKVLAAQSLFGYPLRMTNTATDTAPEFADYCGRSVIVLEVEHTEYGTLAFIQFEDGREDQVPITTLNFLN
jgi:hypothetical protein